MRFTTFSKVAALASTALFINLTHSSAADTTISSGSTVGTVQNLTGAGDSLTIENDGTLDLPGTAIYVSGANGQVTNRGVVRNSNSSVYGLYSVADYTTLNNFGRIETAGECAYGIFAEGDHFKLTNNGTILTTANNNSYGVYFQSADNGSITNNGTIETHGSDADGIAIWSGLNTRIENHGTIDVRGDDAMGVYAWHNSAVDSGIVLVNTGTIRSTATQTLSGDGGQGIYANARGMHVINSGTVVSTNAEAIRMSQDDQILSLLQGSRIEGAIRFDQNATATLNIGRGLNASLEIQGMPNTINTNGQSYVISGNVLTVVDASQVASANMGASATSSAVTNLVGSHLAGRRQGNVGGAVSPMAYQPVDGNGQLTQASPGYDYGAWVNAYGSFLVPVGSRGETRSNHGGAVFGFDARFDDAYVLGGFIGAGYNASRNTSGSDLDTTMGLAGVYGNLEFGNTFVDLTATFGVTSNRNTRAIINNTVAGGLEYAKGDYTGAFFSPAVSVGSDYELENLRLTPRVTLQYAGIYQDGYSESGSSSNLTFGSQFTNAFTASGEIELGRLRLDEVTSGLRSSVKLGVEGTLLDGGDMNANVLGTSLSIQGTNETQARGFIGADFGLTQGRYDLSLKGEVGYSTNGTLSVNVQTGLRVKF